MITPRGLRMVLTVKKRQQDKLDEAHNAARQALQAQQQEADRLGESMRESLDQERKAMDALLQRMGDARGFQSDSILLLRHLLDAREQDRIKAEKAHRSQEGKVIEAEQVRQSSQRAVARGQELLKVIGEKLDEIVRDQGRSQDDMQDEEIEENAVARMMRSRQKRKRSSTDVEC